MTAGCRKCGHGTFRVYFAEDGSSETCANCGHPRAGNMEATRQRLRVAAATEQRLPPPRTCHSCAGKVLDAPLCNTCTKDIARWLRSIETLDAELAVAIAKQTRFADQQQRVKGTPTPPLPLQPEAAETRDTLAAVMRGWVLLYHDENEPAEPLIAEARPRQPDPAPERTPAVPRCDLSDLPTNQCACRNHRA